MNTLIILSAILASAVARPGLLLSPQLGPLTSPLILTKLVPGAPIGLDGRVVDTPEVALAKAEHAAAHINERFTLANEALKSADNVILTSNLGPLISTTGVLPGVALDGHVIDTAEVALAKAEHAAAHINAKVGLIAEAGKSSYGVPLVLSSYPAATIQKYLI